MKYSHSTQVRLKEFPIKSIDLLSNYDRLKNFPISVITKLSNWDKMIILLSNYDKRFIARAFKTSGR